MEFDGGNLASLWSEKLLREEQSIQCILARTDRLVLRRGPVDLTLDMSKPEDRGTVRAMLKGLI